MLVGISGKKFVGKDTVADMFAKVASPLVVQKAAFADTLKRVGSNISGIPLEWFYDVQLKERIHPCCCKSPRRVMEEANGIFKECWGDDVFVVPVAKLFAESSAGLFIATDVRFEVEADWVRSQGGFVVHVLRDTGYSSNAKSEQGVVVQPTDFVINNSSTLGFLEYCVLGAYHSICEKGLTNSGNLLI